MTEDARQTDARDVEAVLAAVGRLRLRDSADAPEYAFDNLVLCLIQAVFSVGIRYKVAMSVVEHFADWWDLEVGDPSARSDVLTMSRVLERMPAGLADPGPERADLARQVFGNLNRTSSVNGILKATAVLQLADVCARHGVETTDDLLDRHRDTSFEDEFRSVRGQGSGTSLRYLYMLSGHGGEAKPDRMVLRFLSRALGRTPSADDAVAILCAATEHLQEEGLDVTVRDVDYAIWREESGQEPYART